MAINSLRWISLETRSRKPHQSSAQGLDLARQAGTSFRQDRQAWVCPVLGIGPIFENNYDIDIFPLSQWILKLQRPWILASSRLEEPKLVTVSGKLFSNLCVRKSTREMFIAQLHIATESKLSKLTFC